MHSGIDIMRLRNLRVLSKLEVGDKLCTRQHPFTIMKESNHLYQVPYASMYRWLYCESRDQTIDAICALINSCVQSETQSKNHERVSAELKLAARGIACLVETYRDDRTSVSSLEIIIDTINSYSDSGLVK